MPESRQRPGPPRNRMSETPSAAIAARSSQIRYPPSWSAWSAASWASSGTRTSPSSPSVQVSRVTDAPSATYRAIVAPLLIVSSSGWAWTKRARREAITLRSCRIAPRPRRSTLYVDRDDSAGLGEVAGGRVALAVVDQRRRLQGADLLRLPAAGPEPAARGRVGRAGDVALQQDPVLLPPQRRLVQWHRGEQGLRVGVRRGAVDLILRALLH